MAPVAERLVPAEAAAAELDLSGDLGGGRLDDIAGVVEDHDRAFDDDRARGLERDGDELTGFIGGHWGNIRRKDGKTERRKVLETSLSTFGPSVFPSYAVLNPSASSSKAWNSAAPARSAEAMPCAVTRGSAIRWPR